MTGLRLWHQSLTDLGMLDAYRRGLTDHLAEVVTDDVVVDLHGMSSGTYTSRYPGSRIHQVYLQSLHKEQFVSAALTAESAGYDGMIIATIPDLALEECRSLVDIPVVGFGEASFKVASMLGSVIGVVTFDVEHLEPQLRRNAERYGVGPLLGPMAEADASFDHIVEGLAGGDADRVVSAVTEAGRELIARGAQVIVPGPGPMNLLMARQGLTRIDDVPVIDSLRASAEMCAMLARMRRAGVYPHRSGFYWGRPERAQLAAAREVYGLSTPG